MIKLFYMVLQKEEKILQEKRGPPKEVSLLDLDDCKYFTHPDLSYSIFEKEKKESTSSFCNIWISDTKSSQPYQYSLLNKIYFIQLLTGPIQLFIFCS